MRDLMEMKVKWIVSDSLGRKFHLKNSKTFTRAIPFGMPIGQIVVMVTTDDGDDRSFEGDPCLECDKRDGLGLVMDKVRLWLRRKDWSNSYDSDRE
jgi:hypothetical protein